MFLHKPHFYLQVKHYAFNEITTVHDPLNWFIILSLYKLFSFLLHAIFMQNKVDEITSLGWVSDTREIYGFYTRASRRIWFSLLCSKLSCDCVFMKGRVLLVIICKSNIPNDIEHERYLKWVLLLYYQRVHWHILYLKRIYIYIYIYNPNNIWV